MTARRKEIVSIFPSRRFGKLLSINLSPIEQKTCSFNCVYCCTGCTSIKKNELSPEETYSWEEVSSELRDAPPTPDGNLIAEYYFRDIELNPTFDGKQFTRAAL